MLAHHYILSRDARNALATAADMITFMGQCGEQAAIQNCPIDAAAAGGIVVSSGMTLNSVTKVYKLAFLDSVDNLDDLLYRGLFVCLYEIIDDGL